MLAGRAAWCWERARGWGCAGYNDVLDDPTMGWARYAHSMRVFVFNSGLFYIRSTPAAMDLLDRVVEVVENTGGWDQVFRSLAAIRTSAPRLSKPRSCPGMLLALSPECVRPQSNSGR